MSKSRGTFVTADTYLRHLNPEYLRYYFAAKLAPRIEDIDLNLDDFQQRVNSDLVGKVVNIASRCAGFLTKRFGGETTGHYFGRGRNMRTVDEILRRDFDIEQFSLLNLEEIKPLLDQKIKDISIDEIK